MSYDQEVTQLLESGAKSYAVKDYEKAVSHYGEACAKYSESNESKEDPNLLYLYGKALFQVAVSKNGLFGGADSETNANVEDEEENGANGEESNKGNGLYQFSEDVPLAEEEDLEEEEEDEEEEDLEEEEEDEEEEKVGEESNITNNETEHEDQEQEDEEPQQSDFEIAWEILDLSRSLFEQEIQDLTKGETKELEKSYKPEESEDKTVQLTVKISEIHDLLGEISLETENFKQATEDFDQALKLREKIYPFNSNLISEIHYKLSLALEFTFDDSDTANKTKAIDHLNKAIESIKQREKENPDDLELIKDLEIRLEELKKDPNEQFDLQKQEILKGILGQATTESSSASTPSTSSTTQKPINDLTANVKKRKAKPTPDASKKVKN